METNTLKILAGDIVTKSELTRPAKLQLLNWLQNEATEVQIKAMLLDGQIVHLDEQAEEIVNIRFNIYEQGLSEAGTLMGIIGALTGILPIWRALAVQFSDAQRQCGTFKISKDRDACMAKARMGYAKRKIEAMKKAQGDCKSYKNPQACLKVLSAHIKKEMVKMSKQQEKVRALTMKGRAAGEDPAKLVATRV